METISVSRAKLEEIFADVERLVSHVENLVEEQDLVVRERLADVQEGRVEGRSEAELDAYLQKRGVKLILPLDMIKVFTFPEILSRKNRLLS